MANTYFSFKQFTVDQDKCAMKVCTDACLFGAWTVRKIQQNSKVDTILDIGTGTGLLSLMLAQKLEASIDAIEINGDASEQAESNCKASPWKTIKVHNVPINVFDTKTKYDLIISNPPFYENSLQSPDESRNAAMHNSYLSLSSLLKAITRLLAPSGHAAILLPFSREMEFSELVNSHQLFVEEIKRVQQTPTHDFFRSMFFISSTYPKVIRISEMSIRAATGHYTEEFKNLLEDYYLHF